MLLTHREFISFTIAFSILIPVLAYLIRLAMNSTEVFSKRSAIPKSRIFGSSFTATPPTSVKADARFTRAAMYGAMFALQ